MLLATATAVAGATGATTGTFGTVRTADAFDTLFSCSVQVPQSTAQDRRNEYDYNYINRIHRQLLTQRIVCLDLLVSPGAHINQYAGKGHYKNQTTHKTSAKAAGSNQGADLINQITNGEAGAQL